MLSSNGRKKEITQEVVLLLFLFIKMSAMLQISEIQELYSLAKEVLSAIK
jgi:hypothetical protein